MQIFLINSQRQISLTVIVGQEFQRVPEFCIITANQYIVVSKKNVLRFPSFPGRVENSVMVSEVNQHF